MNRIQELRKEKNWRQEDLAARLSITRQAVANHEAGRRDLSSGLIVQLCEIFGCTADYLLCISSVRTPVISADDAALVAAYHAAPPSVAEGIDVLLAPYKVKKITTVG